jgi:hypothetical protein
MVQARFVIIEHLPLTPNGKVDRAALPSPLVDADGDDDGNDGEGRVWSRLELELRPIWNETLRIRRCGVDANFFELGGHSLLATLLTLRVSKALQRDISVSMLLQNPTIELLARALEAADRDDSRPKAPDLVADVRAAGPFGRVAEPNLSGLGGVNTLLLTGATGFLGAFLFASLLRRSRTLRVGSIVKSSSSCSQTLDNR